MKHGAHVSFFSSFCEARVSYYDSYSINNRKCTLSSPNYFNNMTMTAPNTLSSTNYLLELSAHSSHARFHYRGCVVLLYGLD
mmetsp:Transcript_23993/g.54595  ORF Transcript_23993/g.54595 Transcript_23993/m.54595 type:complete len:82 (+) Transcript_23993:2700-2945(+)